MDTTFFQPKYISAQVDIAAATLSAARTFNLGGNPVQLGLDTAPKKQMGLVHRFELNASNAKKLGRKENILECISSGITSRSSRAEIDRYLRKLHVPDFLREHAQFYLVSARRRTPKDSRFDTILSKKHEIVAEEHFILGLVEEAKQLKLMIIPSGKRGVVMMNTMKLMKALEPEDDDQKDNNTTSDTATSYPDDRSQDFAVCYDGCMDEVPDWLKGVVTGVCASCLTLIAVAAVPGGQVAAPLLIGACAGCVLAIGSVIGNCILTCHEMLGQ
jgi:hypothetical protein